jgi:hypothetical protein
MLRDEFPEYGIRSPASLGGTPTMIHLHVDDADAIFARAVRAGGTLEKPVRDAFHGERQGTVRCPFGHRWLIGQSLETPEPGGNATPLHSAVRADLRSELPRGLGRSYAGRDAMLVDAWGSVRTSLAMTRAAGTTS